MISFSTSVSAEEPIEKGLDWLYLHQNPDSSWGDSLDIVNPYHTSAAVLNAFWALEIEDSASIGAKLWLSNQPVNSIDYISRRIEIFTRTEPDTLGLIDSLVLLQNSDGGYGLCSGFQSENWDGLLALRAFDAAGFSNTEVIDALITYLVDAQRYDNSWSLSEYNPTSSVFITAKILYILDMIYLHHRQDKQFNFC